MSSLEKHLQETLFLTNSLCIKLSDTALAINKGLNYNNYEIPSDKRKWKYYLNLSGQKHESNQDVMITVMEKGTKEVLTKELLEEFSYTKRELQKQQDYYKQLLMEYPNEEMYIKGCIYPVDIDTAINAEDGTILNYNKSLVEPSELSLIPELEKHIKDFINRWKILEYGLVDELYIASFQAVLFASIPSKIVNIRLDKMNSNEAHSFHLKAFFDSKLRLWNDMFIFKNETKYWLYKHLPYLIKDIGKNETLQKIADKVFSPNFIGLGEYKLNRPDPTLSADKNDLGRESYDIQEPTVNIYPLNDSYEVDTDSVLTLNKIITDELNSIVAFTDRTLSDNYVLEQTKKDLLGIHNVNLNIQNTKILDIKINRFFKNYGVDLFKTIMDYWAYILDMGKSFFTIDFKDANTESNSVDADPIRLKNIREFVDGNVDVSYTITPYQGFLFLIKILLTITGDLKSRIINYNYDLVLNADPLNLRRIYGIMYHDGLTDGLLEDLIRHYPKVDMYVFNGESFHDYISNIMYYYTYIWTLDANSESCVVSSNIKQLYYINMRRDSVRLIKDNDPISGLTIDELLLREGFTYNIPDTFDPMVSLNSLVKAFTGFNIDDYYTKAEILAAAKDFVKKMTAYTTQVTSTSDDIKSIYIYYNNLAPFRTKNPIIGNIKAKFDPYEHNYFELSAFGYNILDEPVMMIENFDWKQSNFERTPSMSGIGAVTNVELPIFNKDDAPRTIAEIKDIYVYPATKGTDITPIELPDDVEPPTVE